MLIYHHEVSLEDGFRILAQENKESRLVHGKKVSRPSGYALFEELHRLGQPMKCWKCGVEASCFVSNRGPNDHVRSPVLDLFAIKNGVHTLMTRDHIIPKSLGGDNSNANLRVGCGPCNHGRGNDMDAEDIAFMKAHPELWAEPEKKPVIQANVPLTPEERAVRERLKRKKKRARAVQRRKELRELIAGPQKHPLISMMVLALA